MGTGLDGTLQGLPELILAILKQHVAHNRSALPPFRLPGLAKEIAEGLVGSGPGPDPEAVRALGERFGRAGLGLRSMTAVQRGVVHALLARGVVEETAAAIDHLTFLAEGVGAAELKELASQRQEMLLLLEQAVQGRETELRRIIQDLSTPIMPVHEHILVLPLVGGIDEERAQRVTERLLAAVVERRAHTIIIDITGIGDFDVTIADSLLRAARAVRLLGARVLLVGIHPDLAVALTRRNVALHGLVTLADLQSGIAYALHAEGLEVRETAARARKPGARA